MTRLASSLAVFLCASSLTFSIQAADSNADVAAIDHYMQRASELEQSISELQARVARVDRKPYLDPKQHRRGHWNRMIGSKSRELDSVKREIAELNKRQGESRI